MLYLLGTGRLTLTKLLGLSDSQPDKPPEGQLIFWFCDSFFSHFSWITMRNMPGELAWFVGLIYQPPPSCSPPLSDILCLLRFSLSLAPSLFLSPSFSPFALFPSSQGKSSYLNWPQEPVLSDFNAPYSVDSISITLVTKD